MLFHALAWRRLLGLSARERPQRRLRLDAMPPPIAGPAAAAAAELGEDVATIAGKIAPLSWRVPDDAPARVNLLIPTIDLEHFFGGYIAKFNLAQRLAERGARVRIVTVDPVPPLPPPTGSAGWRRTRAGGLFDRVEVAFGRESRGIEGSRARRLHRDHLVDGAHRRTPR